MESDRMSSDSPRLRRLMDIPITRFKKPVRKLRIIGLVLLAVVIAISFVACVAAGALLGVLLAERLDWKGTAEEVLQLAMVVIAVSGFGLFIGFCSRLRQRSSRRRCRAIGLAQRGRPFDEYAFAISDASSRIEIDIEHLAKELLDEAAVRGESGWVIRVNGSGEAPAAFRFLFEPTLLDELDDCFDSIMRGHELENSDKPRAAAAETFESVESIDSKRHAVRSLRRLGRWLPSAILLGCLIIAILKIASGARDETLAMALLMFSVLVAIMMFSGVGRPRDRDRPLPIYRYAGEWFLVPSGVLIRWPDERIYQAVLFDSVHGNVVLTQQGGQSWTLRLGVHVPAEISPDGRSMLASAERELTEREYKAFLAAWLSPFSPPTIEQVEVWCGG